jgi:Tol biopolymer transport system component
VLLNTDSEERWAQLSPDARYVTYMSNESGRYEIYVRPFVESGPAVAVGQWQVSTAGGITPAWRPDGRELYYIAPDGTLMAAPIQAHGATLEPNTPVPLFSTRIVGGDSYTGQGREYDVSRDGRFLINTVAADAASSPITLLQNWKPAAK